MSSKEASVGSSTAAPSSPPYQPRNNPGGRGGYRGRGRSRGYPRRGRGRGRSSYANGHYSQSQPHYKQHTSSVTNRYQNPHVSPSDPAPPEPTVTAPAVAHPLKPDPPTTPTVAAAPTVVSTPPPVPTLASAGDTDTVAGKATETEDNSVFELPKGIVTFIGAGNMACALIRGILARGMDPARIRASARTQLTLSQLRGTLPESSLFTSNTGAVLGAGMVVLCVKPHYLSSVCEEIASALRPHATVVSVAAGVTLAELSRALTAASGTTLVRAMPNVAAAVGRGATGLCSADSTPPADALALFAASGTVSVVEERLMSVVTAVSGCGVAYCMMFAEALADAGVRHGLPREAARTLSAATLEGAGAIATAHPDVHFAQLRNSVESPGGVTIAATAALENGGFRAAALDAVDKAMQRISELEAATAAESVAGD